MWLWYEFNDKVARRFSSINNPKYTHPTNSNIAPDDRAQYAKDGMDKDLMRLADYIGGLEKLKPYIDDMINRGLDPQDYQDF